MTKYYVTLTKGKTYQLRGRIFLKDVEVPVEEGIYNYFNENPQFKRRSEEVAEKADDNTEPPKKDAAPKEEAKPEPKAKKTTSKKGKGKGKGAIAAMGGALEVGDLNKDTE